MRHIFLKRQKVLSITRSNKRNISPRPTKKNTAEKQHGKCAHDTALLKTTKINVTKT